MKAKLLALTVSGVWIALLCTAPQVLGGVVWRRLGDPLSHLLTVALNSAAVLGFALLTRRSSLLVPRRPRSPIYLLALVPLAVLNFVRGPVREGESICFLVILGSTFLTGFWEEFLFRGLIQGRLSVLGRRGAVFWSSLMFALIHLYKGLLKTGIAFSIGLVFGLLRDRVGIWPLVLVHFLIDLGSGVFRPGWDASGAFAYGLLGVYLVLGLVDLVRRGGPPPTS